MLRLTIRKIASVNFSRKTSGQSWIIYGINEKEWKSIVKGIQKELKCIEQLAVDDVQAAYVRCLEYQMKYALNENEAYFEVYGMIFCDTHNHFDCEWQVYQLDSCTVVSTFSQKRQ